ncbi:ABC transporter ATP-binding protein [Actibacterium sp. 188UL27-1]|uniref:ABC transporter ATP-binding protein n=1 Tax=Actibacterium sp. 188UL27-1 TaxID=2786961 RepID=UPI00195AD950|nr:sn-glycerol-3-phosphate ABC transporter ATP-binding protein UgpC [Actibacterium sp. 188UL27-1]MBM7068681.1 sn-glycerol-3-phosphate ABC transporter ATP-binding protein UgpC [Actibacterium sp. 188UL27-1]
MPHIEFNKITKDYGAVNVIRDLDLAVEDGHFTVLLGTSGCGKTTLLRMTAGLETITGGELTIGNQRMNEVHPRDRDIAMVFQNYALYPTMSVRENIGFSLEVAKMSKGETAKKVNEAAAVLNLTDFLDRYPRELSGGQRQRVAMGRAMVREASVFLFDEPLSNLDAKLRAHMRLEIRQLHDRLKTTTLYVTHDQIEAMTMADKIVLMKDGKIEQSGSPDDLYDRPATKYVADFIGSPAINFIHGTIEAENGTPVFASVDIRYPLAPDCAAQPGQAVICGLRPSDLEIAVTGDISATVMLAEKTGAEQNLHLKAGEQHLIVVADRAVPAPTGQSVDVRINTDRIHLFDAMTEQRI